MFLHISVHREVVPPPLGQYPLDHTFPGPINTPLPPETTIAVGTHPTGMLSYVNFISCRKE